MGDDSDQTIGIPSLLDRQRGIGWVFIDGQWHKMSQPMYDDRQLRDIVFQHQQAEIDQAEAENQRLRTELLYKRVLEHYNRAHGQNPKITLKQVCEKMSVSYDAVRQYRSRERKRKNPK